MKRPRHPGEVLREAIDELGLSVTAAAGSLGVARGTLSAILNGRAGVSPETAVRLEKAVGGTAAHWLRLQTAFDRHAGETSR